MQLRKLWVRARDGGYLMAVFGALLIAAMWAADRAAPRGSLVFDLETLGLILLLVGIGLATAGGIALGSMWPYGPIK